MANTIRIKRRAAGGASGAPASLENAELAFNEQDKTLYYGEGTGGAGGTATQVIAIGGAGAFVDKSTDQTIAGIKTFTSSPVVPTLAGGDNSTKAASTAFVQAAISAASIPDGDKGDITVSGSGSSWTVDAGAITNAKLADMNAGTIKGRITTNGAPQDLTTAQVRTLLNVADGATANNTDAFLLDRANHTGSQAISTVTGLQTALDGKAPSTTGTSILKGNGTGGFSSAVAGTDYLAPNGNGSQLTGLVFSQIGSRPTTLSGYGITDALGLAGGTLTGKLTTVASAAGSAGLSIPHGAAPTAPVNGDVWTTTTGVFARVNGATQQLANTGTWTAPSQAEAEAGSATTDRVWTAQRVNQAIQALAPVKSVAGKTGVVTLVKGDVGLGNVDNTADVDKPISTATQTALNGKVDTTSLGAANGVATLGSDGKLTAGQIPATAITDTFVVANQAAMLALTAEVGDIAVRTDLNKTFILRVVGAGTLANWQELLTPTDTVQSVFGRSGVVVAQTGDYTVAQITGAAPLASPALTGTPTAPTASTADNSTQIATTAFVKAQGYTTNTGTVTSVAVSGGTTGLTTSGGPITGSGTITIAGTLAVANGGTGGTTATAARTNLGLGTMATQNANAVAITGGTIDGIVLDGGTF